MTFERHINQSFYFKLKFLLSKQNGLDIIRGIDNGCSMYIFYVRNTLSLRVSPTFVLINTW